MSFPRPSKRPVLVVSTPAASIHLLRRSAPALGVKFFLHHVGHDRRDQPLPLIQETQPTEIYNLAAQSHVQVSFETPEYTANPTRSARCGCSRRSASCAWQDDVRFYQASTSELFGKVQETPQRETTPFYPRSPTASPSSTPTGSR
jgi:GDPmannose 4,6-dehydratase